MDPRSLHEDDWDYVRTLLPTDLEDRKSTRLNSSHRCISYAVFCLKKKQNNKVGLVWGVWRDRSIGNRCLKSKIRRLLKRLVIGVGLRFSFDLLFFFNDPAPPEISTLSLHAALPI